MSEVKHTLEQLKEIAMAATKCDLNTADRVHTPGEAGEYMTCPCCDGEGSVDCGNDYLNIDCLPLGVQFYGMGAEPQNNENYFRAFNPKTALILIDAAQQRDHLLGALKKVHDDFSGMGEYGAHYYDIKELIAAVEQSK